MILFRITGLLALWYYISIAKSPVLFDAHFHAEESCQELQRFLEHYFAMQIEHPLYGVEILCVAIAIYAICRILDKSLGMITLLGAGSILLYTLFF